MDKRLLIEATEELLDGWCGPVVECGADTVWVGSGRRFWDAYGVDSSWQSREGVTILLDLSRAECRDRVARVLGERFSELMTIQGAAVVCGVDHPYVWLGDWDVLFAGSPTEDDAEVCVVPELLTLDLRADDARLPDGSRLVYALALAAVWREVTRGDR